MNYQKINYNFFLMCFLYYYKVIPTFLIYQKKKKKKKKIYIYIYINFLYAI